MALKMNVLTFHCPAVVQYEVTSDTGKREIVDFYPTIVAFVIHSQCVLAKRGLDGKQRLIKTSFT